MIAGTDANLSEAQPTHLRRVRLMRSLRRLRADFVLIDLGAGVHSAVLDYFLVADEGLVVLSPEPTSVENAYTFLRAAFYRRMRLAMVGHGVRKLVTTAMDQRNERGLRTPLDLLRQTRVRGVQRVSKVLWPRSGIPRLRESGRGCPAFGYEPQTAGRVSPEVRCLHLPRAHRTQTRTLR
ncbi:MAG: hypothetical protein JRG94_27390 [Deltaproteobacteria bacterium]|nr:hypothetical protein [Deltaproteobacteria bacterium]